MLWTGPERINSMRLLYIKPPRTQKAVKSFEFLKLFINHPQYQLILFSTYMLVNNGFRFYRYGLILGIYYNNKLVTIADYRYGGAVTYSIPTTVSITTKYQNSLIVQNMKVNSNYIEIRNIGIGDINLKFSDAKAYSELWRIKFADE